MAEKTTEVAFKVFAIYKCPNCSKNNKRLVYREVADTGLRAFQCNCGETIWVKGAK